MTKIFNGTPHAINVVEGAIFNPTIRKYTGGTVVLSIPSNGMLNAKILTVSEPPIFIDGVAVPVFDKAFDGVDPLPEGYDVYIVSALYSSAYQKKYKTGNGIFTVADPVMSEDGSTFIGCRGICPAF